ncbi:MAG: glycosyltransferase family 2 protein [Actinomycetota bacterium]|nr:glycosyltransferase family 2 protein [Actinomycetota bacterium]
MKLSYVLPLRRWRVEPLEELTAYLRWLAPRAEVIVVDGSASDVFATHHAAWGELVSHVPVDPTHDGLYGKVNGVLTGVEAAHHERVVIADDDVRYDETGLARVSALLDDADLVRPQNYFDPLPWHAQWDTARTLLNRALGGDYPGTLALRRSVLLHAGGYDADALFENLELMRTIRAVGGRVVTPLDLYVRRLPSSAGHFWSQRVRQAYDDFALPARMAAELAMLPGAVAVLLRRRPAVLGAAALGSVAAAEFGRRRAGGAPVFPATCSLLAPVWLAERAVCAWVAVWQRLALGGVPYAGTVLRKAANSERALRRRLAQGGGTLG